jgi:adenosine deaminase
LARPAAQSYNRIFVLEDFLHSFLRGSVCHLLLIFLLGSLAAGQGSEQRAARYFESVRNSPPLVLAFLEDMPKGGDLHNHLFGAIYAEDLIDFAAYDNLCVERTSSRLIAPPCDSCAGYSSKPGVRCAYADHVLYGQIVDAWSMRNWRGGDESGHDHFFASFDKFDLATYNHIADMLAAALNQAGRDHLQYVEFMHTADRGAAAKLAASVGWNSDWGKLRQSLLAGGLKEIAAAAGRTLAEDEKKARAEMKCGTAEAEPGCAVTVRFLYQALRGLPPDEVFAQILLGFELASSDPHFVGFNLVMPEDWYVPMHDFKEHMAMIDRLHSDYPKVHISLHAGEIALGLVPPEDLIDHIRDSIERGHAERIGHGVDIMNETDPISLLHEMAKRNVLVEINLTSNELILGISGDEHPLPVYMKYGVPVALSSDDEGVSRTDMTHEYLRAAETYHLSYGDLKGFARQSLEHSFLPGQSLWAGSKPAFRRAAPCAASVPGKQSPKCSAFLLENERAREQWKLEGAFAEFEKKF